MLLNANRNQSETAIALRAYMAATGKSQGQVAKAIGMAGSTISAYLAGSYKGDIEGTEEKIRQYLQLEEERRGSAIGTAGIVETSVFQTMTKALATTERKLELAVITGGSGIGKTTTLTEYARTHKSAILIEADPGYTATALFCELCHALSIPSKGSLHDLMTRVIDKLSGSGRLIIIDEAEQLKPRVLDLIRRVHDKAKVPIALVGLDQLRSNLQGDRMSFTYLWSRCGFVRKVDVLTEADERALIHSRLGPVDDEIVDDLRAESKRNARTLVKLLGWCSDLCRINNTQMDSNVVRHAVDLVRIA